MHFYDFNIGEYAKKTQHLSNEEDLAYRRALDLYYDTEKPLDTGGLATLSRRLRVDEQALKNVLDEFFPGGVNKHAEEKIAAYYAYIAKQQANGKLGGRPKREPKKPTANPPLTQAKPSAKPPLTTNHYPDEEQNTFVSSKLPTCPHREIIDAYSKALPTLPQPRIWEGAREKNLAARWRWVLSDLAKNGKPSDAEAGLAYFRRFFDYVSHSDFLTGRAVTWSADLGWIVKAENFAKILQGNYENKQEIAA